MSKSYVIQWKSTVNGRTGSGTKLFDWEEAQQLADELNQEYPSIWHEPAEASLGEERASGTQPRQLARQPERAEESEVFEQPEPGSESPHVTHDPDPALSFQ
jgi:hypothetical protein